MTYKPSPLFLGVDGGGTKTKVVVIDADRRIVGRGSADGSNANIFGFDESIKNIGVAIKKALPGNRSREFFGCFAIAGVNTKKDIDMWKTAVGNDKYLSSVFPKSPMIVNDTVAALRAGTNDGNAIVIIAGTGSNCYGRNEQGKEAKSGGLDWILSDEGSAYAIGKDILHSVVRDLDGRGKTTFLTKLLLEKLSANTLDDLSSSVYQKPWNKTDIAACAPLAEIAAEKNDTISKSILKQAAGDLGRMVRAVAEKLNLLNKKYTVVYTGSVFNVQKLLLGEFKNKVLEFSPNVEFKKPEVDSATGAAYLARDKAIGFRV